MANNDERRLAALIQARKDAGESLRHMSARANKAGHDISHAHIADLLNGQVRRAPLPTEIVAIAAALDVSYEVVRRAVLHDWYDYEELRAGDFDALVAPLAESERAEAERMLRAWLTAKRS